MRNPYENGGAPVSADKALIILHDKTIKGHPITDKQRRFFGSIASGTFHGQNGGSTVHINPEHKGMFTAWAKSHGMSVKQAASRVMANKENYSGHVVQMANFAKNFTGKPKAMVGGTVEQARKYFIDKEGYQVLVKDHLGFGMNLGSRKVQNGGTPVFNYGGLAQNGTEFQKLDTTNALVPTTEIGQNPQLTSMSPYITPSFSGMPSIGPNQPKRKYGLTNALNDFDRLASITTLIGGAIGDARQRGAQNEQYIRNLQPKVRQNTNEQLNNVPAYMQAGGEVPSTPDQRKNWNDFLSYINQKGYRGNKDLDVRDKSLGISLLKEYNQEHPNSQVTEDFINTVQRENSLMNQGVFPGMTEEQSADLLKRAPYLKEYVSRKTSPIDNWFGSVTSTLHYPTVKKMNSKKEEYDYGTNLNDFLAASENPSIAEKYRKTKMQNGGYNIGDELDLSPYEIERLQKQGFDFDLV